MQRTNEVTTAAASLTKVVETPLQAPRAAINPAAADPLLNRGDLSFLKTRQTMETYASALPGTAPREFFDRVNSGEPAGQAVARVRDQFGTVIPGEDLEAAKEYQAKRLLSAPMIELDLGQAPSPVMKPGVSAPIPGSYETEGRGTQLPLNNVQRAAQAEYQTKLNHGISEAAGALGAMEAHGLTNTPEYEAVAARYQNLLHAANPTATSLDLARAREAGILRLSAMDEQAKARVSPALMAHYETLARGGGPAGLQGAGATRRIEQADVSLTAARQDLEAKLNAFSQLPKDASPQHRDDTIMELDRAKANVIQAEAALGRAQFPLGTGMPKPAINGRYAGQENPQDLPLNRDNAILAALNADPHAPNAKLLMSQAGVSPQEMGLDQKALQAMWQDSRFAAAKHQVEMNAVITEAPAPALTLEERLGSQVKAGLTPSVTITGPGSSVVDPWGDDRRGPEGPGDGGKGPGGPGETRSEGPTATGPALPGTRQQWAPPSSPEAHSAAVLEREISEISMRAKKEMDRQKLLLALDLFGNMTVAAAESAVAIGSAPINGDAGQTLTHVATGFRDSIGRYGEYREQALRVTNKADVDIKNMLAQHAKEQRDFGEMWAEHMDNQMDHLKEIPVDVAAMDKAEQAVGQTLMEDEPWRKSYLDIRDHDANAIHMSAADDMRMSPDPEIRRMGQAAAEELKRLPLANWEEGDKRLNQAFAANPKQADIYFGYRAMVGDKHFEFARQQEAHARLVEAVSADKAGTLARLSHLSDSKTADILVNGNGKTPGIFDLAVQNAAENARNTKEEKAPEVASEVLQESLNRKAKIERSVDGAWRFLTSKAPVHANQVISGGYAPEHQLAALYGRRLGVDQTPDRKAASDIRGYFVDAMTPKPGDNRSLQTIRAQEGIPDGWGVQTNLGRKVGVALSQNDSVQSLMLGHDPAGKLQQASVHLFAKERMRVSTETLQASGLSGDKVALFHAADKEATAQGLNPGVRAQVLLSREDLMTTTARGLEKVPVVGRFADKLPQKFVGPDALAVTLTDKYNDAVTNSFDKQQRAQLNADAWKVAALKLGITDPKAIAAYSEKTAGADKTDALKIVADYKAQFGAESGPYAQRGRDLAHREFIGRGVARPMAVQILGGKDTLGFQQTVESNTGGHFNYPPSQSGIDPKPQKALTGSDFRRAMDVADHKFTALAAELATARDKGVSLTKNPNLLAETGLKARTVGAILDAPIRQSEMGGRVVGGNAYKEFQEQKHLAA